ncbi:hypothetical protein MNBD_GAMMA24-548 [hydrothermal vent metagenome]|uniref:M23ase beta-sheet core domain-containing protein n=1 Tax=hydrothermal vent metagenome TaxID=652676 RepID=A0A3B1BSZ2_9ZZZZ
MLVILVFGNLLVWPGWSAAAQNNHSGAKKSQVTLINRGTDRQPIFDVYNNYYGPIEFELSADEFVNMKSEPALPIQKVIPAKTTVQLCRLTQISAHEPWSYTYSTRYVLGKPGVRHLTGKPYGLPFGEIQQFVISQGFNGRRSHQTPATKYAIDIDMPQGTEVLAMRSGRVMEITRARLNNDKKSVPALQIRILHQDGTMGLYAHLKKGSIAVHEGQRVHRGQLIAASGPSYKENVKPHLHFALQRNAGMRLESIPFQITSFSGSGITPKVDLILRHSPY